MARKKQKPRGRLTDSFERFIKFGLDEEQYDDMCSMFAGLIEQVRSFIVIDDTAFLGSETALSLEAIGVDTKSIVRDKVDAILLIAKLLLDQKDSRFTKKSECAQLADKVKSLEADNEKLKMLNESEKRKWENERRRLRKSADSARDVAFAEAEARLKTGRKMRKFFDDYVYNAEKIERADLTSAGLSMEGLVSLVSQFQSTIHDLRTKTGFTEFSNKDI